MPPKRAEQYNNPASRRMTHASATAPPVFRTIETRSRTSGAVANAREAVESPYTNLHPPDRPRSAVELGRNNSFNDPPNPFMATTNPESDIRVMLQEVFLETRNLGSRMDDIECLVDARSASRASFHSVQARPVVDTALGNNAAGNLASRLSANNAAGQSCPSDDVRNYLPLREELDRVHRQADRLNTPIRPTAVAEPTVIRPSVSLRSGIGHSQPLRSSGAYHANNHPSEARSYRSEQGPRLKASDIGYWDPHGRVDSDDKHRPEQMSVQLFTKRLKRLAKKYGEQQVVDNIDAALVHCSSYLETLSEQDELHMESLSGWIYLLLRDFGEPEVIMRQKAQAYSCFDAASGNEFWQEKISLLRRGGMTSERDMYYEVWSSLPTTWRETIPMEGTLDSLCSEIRRREAARGTWPSKRRTSNASTDSGYDSKVSEQSFNRGQGLSSGKRGGSSGAYDNRGEKRVKNVTFSKSRPIPNCRICEELGKPNESHWHRDCPNRVDQRAKVNRMLSILELEDESSAEHVSSAQAVSPADGDTASESDEVVNSVSLNGSPANAKKIEVPLVATNVRVHESNFKSSISLGSGDVFRRSGPISAYVKSSIDSSPFQICIDSGCGPVIGNRGFVAKHWPSANILRRQSDQVLRVKGGFKKQEFEVLLDFVVVPIYFITRSNELFHTQAEIHLTDSYVDSNILFGVAGLKSNGLICNFRDEVLLALSKSGESLQIPFCLDEPRHRIERQAIKATRAIHIPGYHEGLVEVDINLLPDRDYLLEGRQWITKGEVQKVANSLVSRATNKILLGNFSPYPHRVHIGDILGFVSDLDDDDTCSSTNIITSSERPYLRPTDITIAKPSIKISTNYVSNLAPISRVSPIKFDTSCVSGRRVADRPCVVSESAGDKNLLLSQRNFLSLKEAAFSEECDEPSSNRSLPIVEQVHEAVPKLETNDVEIAIALSSFLKEFEEEDYDEEPEVGISRNDIRVNPKYYEIVQNLLSEDADEKFASDSYIEDQWKFSKRLDDHQLSEAKSMLNSIDIWNGIGCLNTGECMPMPIKAEYQGKQSIQASYPMSKSKRDAYDLIEKELESQGIIEDSVSTDYCSPCLIVIQKNKPRFVIDFRKINEMTPADVYPLPRQTDIFQALQGASYISLFDFRKMF